MVSVIYMLLELITKRRNWLVLIQDTLLLYNLTIEFLYSFIVWWTRGRHLHFLSKFYLSQFGRRSGTLNFVILIIEIGYWCERSWTKLTNLLHLNLSLLLLLLIFKLAILTHNSGPRNDGGFLFAHLVELYGFESASLIIYGAELFFVIPRSFGIAILCVYHCWGVISCMRH